MTEILAGLVGGLLALLGGLLLNRLSERRDDREHVSRSAAAFLSEGAMLIQVLSDARRSDSTEPNPAYNQAFAAMSQAGYELIFRAPASIVRLSTDVHRATMLMIAQAHSQTPADVWRDLMIRVGELRLELQQDVRAWLGRPALTDADLGATPPPTNPA